MSSPSQGEANGATRNTYNTAGYLVKVEGHNGTAWQMQSEMRYDGLGNRLEMTAYDEGVGETIQYQLDNGQPLAAVGAESTSFYLYGRGVIGTKTDSWGYILQDGLGSTRQLATHEGVIAMSVAYTPWGDVLEYYGSGDIDFGYLGGMYDDTTGLIYMGGGQYYDPMTGRLLTRGAGSNPYKPGAFDPAGMMVAPFALLGLVLGKKKKRSKWDSLLVLLVMGAVVGMSLSACNPPSADPSPISSPSGTPNATEQFSTALAQAENELAVTPIPAAPPTATIVATITLDGCNGALIPIVTTPTPISTVPGGTGDYSSYYYGDEFYKMLEETPGWWHNYQNQPFGMQTFIAVIYNYEFMSYPRFDESVKKLGTEAFARRYWDAIQNYGPDGAFYYLGGREMAIRRVINKSPGIFETDYDMAIAFEEARKILNPPEDWKGIQEKAPYDWGNPTFSWGIIYEYIPDFYNALKSGNEGPANNQIRYINEEGDFFIITRGQNIVLCQNQSCVNPKGN